MVLYTYENTSSYTLIRKKHKGQMRLTIHLIMGMTIGTHRIIAAIRRRHTDRIIVVDEFHEGPTYEVQEVTYCSHEQSLEIRKDYSNVIYHFFKDPIQTINIHDFDFR